MRIPTFQLSYINALLTSYLLKTSKTNRIPLQSSQIHAFYDQNVQFVIYQDEISFPDSYSSDDYKSSFPVDSDSQTESTRSKVVVKISFRPKIY